MSSPDDALELALRRIMMRQAMGAAGHPEPEELRLYVLGSIEASRRERLQDHLASCRSCARTLLEMRSFAQGDTTIRARGPEAEQAWRRLMRHLELPRRPGFLKDLAGRMAPSAGSLRVWATALAASMVMVTFVALWLDRDAEGPTAEVVVSDLVPEDNVVREVEGRPANYIPVGGERWVWILNLGAVPASSDHRLEIFDADGHRRWRSGLLIPGAYGSFAVELSADYLEPGYYRVVLYGRSGGAEDTDTPADDARGSTREAPVATYFVQVGDPPGRGKDRMP